jgi:hypothetical protein
MSTAPSFFQHFQAFGAAIIDVQENQVIVICLEPKKSRRVAGTDSMPATGLVERS